MTEQGNCSGGEKGPVQSKHKTKGSNLYWGYREGFSEKVMLKQIRRMSRNNLAKRRGKDMQRLCGKRKQV
jgi:hypothetical protein